MTMEPFDAEGYKKVKGDYNLTDEEQLLKQIKDSGAKKVLDVGCGDGVLIGEVRDAMPDAEIVGIDNSAKQIEYARELHPDIPFELIDIVDYVSNTSFDCVYSFYAFPHMPKSDIAKGLASVRNVLTPGAPFFLYTNICDFDTSSISEEEQEACDITFFDLWQSQINLTDMGEMKKMIADAGFKIESDFKQKEGIQVKDYGEMFSWSFVLK